MVYFRLFLLPDNGSRNSILTPGSFLENFMQKKKKILIGLLCHLTVCNKALNTSHYMHLSFFGIENVCFI